MRAKILHFQFKLPVKEESKNEQSRAEQSPLLKGKRVETKVAERRE